MSLTLNLRSLQLHHREGEDSPGYSLEKESSAFGPGPSALLAAATVVCCALGSVCYWPARLWARGEWVGGSISTGYGPTLGPGTALT